MAKGYFAIPVWFSVEGDTRTEAIETLERRLAKAKLTFDQSEDGDEAIDSWYVPDPMRPEDSWDERGKAAARRLLNIDKPGRNVSTGWPFRV